MGSAALPDLEPRPRKFHCLGRAIIEFDAKILLARARGASNTFLPGGHVELGESLTACIARELFEEFALPAIVGSYLGAIEHLWRDEQCDNYEINHLFSASLPTLTDPGDIMSRETHLEFIWASPPQLSELNLQPNPLIDFLSRPALRERPFWASTLKEKAKS